MKWSLDALQLREDMLERRRLVTRVERVRACVAAQWGTMVSFAASESMRGDPYSHALDGEGLGDAYADGLRDARDWLMRFSAEQPCAEEIVP